MRTMTNSNQIQDPELQGYGSIPSATEHTVEQAEAEEGPFPVDLKSMLVAEAFGTFVFVQIGVAANCIWLYTKAFSGFWPVASIWGLALALGIYIAATMSGGHLNPAVTFAFFLVRPADFNFRKVIPYWIAQLIGATLAGFCDVMLFYRAIGQYEHKLHKNDKTLTRDEVYLHSASVFGDYYRKEVENSVHCFFIEAFGTGTLLFAIFALTHRKNPLRGSAIPVLIGITYALLVATLGPLTGASLNPARDVGPRFATAVTHWGTISWKDWLPYIIGPLFGGPIGAFLVDKILML